MWQHYIYIPRNVFSTEALHQMQVRTVDQSATAHHLQLDLCPTLVLQILTCSVVPKKCLSSACFGNDVRINKRNQQAFL